MALSGKRPFANSREHEPLAMRLFAQYKSLEERVQQYDVRSTMYLTQFTV